MQADAGTSKGRLRRDSPSSEDIQPHSIAAEQHENNRNTVSTKNASEHCSLLRVSLILIFFTCIAAMFVLMDKETILNLALEFEKNKGGSGMIWFFMASVIAIACLIPGPVVAGVSGALYGLINGVMLVWVAGTVSQILTYILGRYLFRDMLVSFVSKRYKSFAAIDTVIAQQGWKLVFLLRITPILPDSVLNYVLATTSVPFVPYITASAAAVLPWMIIFTYLGSVAKDVASAANGDLTVDPWLLAGLTILSVTLFLLLGYIIAKAAKKALSEILDDKTVEKSLV